MMAISSPAGWEFCCASHRRVLELMGIEASTIERCLADTAKADLPELHRAIVMFAVKAAADPNSVDDAETIAVQRLGVTQEELVEGRNHRCAEQTPETHGLALSG